MKKVVLTVWSHDWRRLDEREADLPDDVFQRFLADAPTPADVEAMTRLHLQAATPFRDIDHDPHVTTTDRHVESLEVADLIAHHALVGPDSESWEL